MSSVSRLSPWQTAARRFNIGQVLVLNNPPASARSSFSSTVSSSTSPLRLRPFFLGGSTTMALHEGNSEQAVERDRSKHDKL